MLLGRLGIGHVRDRFPAEVSLGEQQRSGAGVTRRSRSRKCSSQMNRLRTKSPSSPPIVVLHLYDGRLSVGVPSH